MCFGVVVTSRNGGFSWLGCLRDGRCRRRLAVVAGISLAVSSVVESLAPEWVRQVFALLVRLLGVL